MKNQFRVISWSQDVTKYSERVVSPDGDTAKDIVPYPIEGTTTFRVELSTVDINSVNQVVGTVYVKVDGLTGYTGEAKLQIAEKLALLGLYEEAHEDPLERAKQLRWNRLLSIRDGLESKGFNYLGKTFDSDQRSILRIGMTAQAAMAAAMQGTDFSIDWTCADNSVLSMTRDQVIGLPVALATHANAIHLQARDLKVALDNAGSIAEVQLVQWPGVEYEVHEAI